MIKFIPESFRRIPRKCKFIPERLDSFIHSSGGYKVFVYINLTIFSLIVVLILVQQSWINKEKKAIKEIVNVHNVDKERNMDKVQNESENLEMLSGLYSSISQEEPHSKNDLLFTIKKKVKEANLYFEFEQYDKAARLYEETSTAKIVFDEKDKVVNNLAECYFYLGKFELAMETYHKVLNDFLNTPYRLNAQLGEGKCLIHLREFGEARRVLYLLVAKEAQYDDEEEKSKVIEAYYKIAESYIAQATEHKDKTQVISSHENL